MKKVIVIVAPLVIIGGFFGLALTGVVNVPGLSPRKAKAPSLYGDGAKMYGDDKKDIEPVAAKEPAKPKEPEKPLAAPPEVDADKGNKKLAQLWNNVPTAKLADMAKAFDDTELADVLVKMDPEKVAELLTAMDPKKSAKLSKELQRVASLVPKSEG